MLEETIEIAEKLAEEYHSHHSGNARKAREVLEACLSAQEETTKQFKKLKENSEEIPGLDLIYLSCLIVHAESRIHSVMLSVMITFLDRLDE